LNYFPDNGDGLIVVYEKESAFGKKQNALILSSVALYCSFGFGAVGVKQNCNQNHNG